MESQGNKKREEEAPERGEQELRFAVLRHEGNVDGPHWDLLVEAERGALRLPTWRLPRWGDPGEEAVTLEAMRLPDHRRAYLTYEGEVSGGRGHVRRVAEGSVTVEAWGKDAMRVILHGQTWERTVEGRRREGERWEMRIDHL